MRYFMSSLCAMFVFAVLGVAGPASAEDFLIHGEFYIYDGEFGTPIAEEVYSRTETDAKESEIIEGSRGNFGEASFMIDLAKGHLGTFVEASNGFAYKDDVFWAGMAEAYARFEDTLNFMIPTGIYRSGLSVTLRAKIEGRVHVDGSLPTLPVTAYQSYDIMLASPLHREDLSHMATEKTPASGNYTIEKSVDLTVQLLENGTILEEPTNVTAYFAAKMAGITRTTRSVQQRALADFYSSLRVIALEVPEGITWTSASGVFLRDIPDIEKGFSDIAERKDK